MAFWNVDSWKKNWAQLRLNVEDSAVHWTLLVAFILALGFRFLVFRSSQFRISSRNQPEKTKTKFIDSTEMGDELKLVEEARRLLVTSGDAERDVAHAMQALAALVNAVRLRDGDGAATALLERGRALFQEREGTDSERDNALMSLSEENSLLKERGAETILNDAFADGSSVLCRKCSGLVARVRWDAHKTQWCPALANQSRFTESESEDDMEVE